MCIWLLERDRFDDEHTGAALSGHEVCRPTTDIRTYLLLDWGKETARLCAPSNTRYPDHNWSVSVGQYGKAWGRNQDHCRPRANPPIG